MPRGLNVTHRELSLTRAVALDIWRPPALQAREDPMPTALAVLSTFSPFFGRSCHSVAGHLRLCLSCCDAGGNILAGGGMCAETDHKVWNREW